MLRLNSMKWMAPALGLALLFACGDGSDDAGATGDELSKEDAARLGGKNDLGKDYCEAFGWYGDQICDTFCPSPDPDCSLVSEFQSFKLSVGGFCPEDVDCSSFYELSADGTLRIDRANELPSQVYEVKIDAVDLEGAVNVLTSDDLVALLGADEEPCVQPQGVTEFMVLETTHWRFSNPTTFCDQKAITSVRDLFGHLEAAYLPATEASFDTFRISSGGFCPPEVDCSAFVELDGDGSIRINLPDDNTHATYEATVSEEDLATARTLLTDEAFLGLLALEEPPCSAPTDVHESMKVVIDGEEFANSTTFCGDAPLEAVRAFAQTLADRYATPPAPAEFVRFRISTNGFCPPDADCNGFIELHADGTLNVDRTGEPGGAVHSAQVSESDVLAAVDVLTADALIALLTVDEPPCEAPTDIFESMTLESPEKTWSNSTTFCDDAPLVAARQVMRDLSEAYLPLED